MHDIEWWSSRIKVFLDKEKELVKKLQCQSKGDMITFFYYLDTGACLDKKKLNENEVLRLQLNYFICFAVGFIFILWSYQKCKMSQSFEMSFEVQILKQTTFKSNNQKINVPGLSKNVWEVEL